MFARFHDLLEKNLSSLLFNINIKEKEEPDIKHDIHEVKDLALDVITANYMWIRYKQIKVYIKQLPILKKMVIVVVMLCVLPQIMKVVTRQKLCSNPVYGKINE